MSLSRHLSALSHPRILYVALPRSTRTTFEAVSARSRQRYLLSSKQTSKSVEKSSVAPKPRFAVNNNNNAIILVYIPSRVRRRNNATLKHYYNALACAQSSCEFDFYRRQPHTGPIFRYHPILIISFGEPSGKVHIAQCISTYTRNLSYALHNIYLIPLNICSAGNRVRCLSSDAADQINVLVLKVARGGMLSIF